VVVCPHWGSGVSRARVKVVTLTRMDDRLARPRSYVIIVW